MKIAFIPDAKCPIPPVGGGAVENLIDAFAAENEKTGEHALTVFSVFDAKAAQMSQNYRHCAFEYVKMEGPLNFALKAARALINRIPGMYIGSLFIAKVMRRICKKGEFDAVVFENSPKFLLLAKKLRAKKILHLHNDALHTGTEFAKDILDAADAVFCVSNFISQRVSTICGGAKVKVLNNGIDLDLFAAEFSESQKAAIRARYGLGPEDRIALYTGRLNAGKGVMALLQAFSKLMPNPSLKLLVVGSAAFGRNVADAFRSELAKAAEAFSENIVFTGYVDYWDLNKLYAIADISCVPSQASEGSGMTVLEGMAAGCAIIASDSGGIPELTEGTDSIIIKRGPDFVENLAQALKRVLSDGELRSKMSESGRARAMMFSRQSYYENFSRLLKESAGDGRNG